MGGREGLAGHWWQRAGLGSITIGDLTSKGEISTVVVLSR
jgi:hypothetical protein